MELEEEKEGHYHKPTDKKPKGGILIGCITGFIVVFLIFVLLFTWQSSDVQKLLNDDITYLNNYKIQSGRR